MSGGGHGMVEGSNKSIALLISVLALFLAFAETLAKSAQTNAIGDTIEASNLWAFFQAKTVRTTVVRTAVEANAIDPADPAQDAGRRKQIEAWNMSVSRWESEPETNEGRKELAARATAASERAATNLSRYHSYEIGSAAFQIAIVLASAMLVTGIVVLAWISVGLGVFGVGLTALGFFAPHVHVF